MICENVVNQILDSLTGHVFFFTDARAVSQFQAVNVVVRAISKTVMDAFLSQQGPPKVLLHNVTMLEHPTAMMSSGGPFTARSAFRYFNQHITVVRVNSSCASWDLMLVKAFGGAEAAVTPSGNYEFVVTLLTDGLLFFTSSRAVNLPLRRWFELFTAGSADLAVTLFGTSRDIAIFQCYVLILTCRAFVNVRPLAITARLSVPPGTVWLLEHVWQCSFHAATIAAIYTPYKENIPLECQAIVTSPPLGVSGMLVPLSMYTSRKLVDGVPVCK